MVQDYCHPKCGDGVRVPSEGCDDGNTKDGDGCSSSCIVETGYVCYGGNSSHADSCKMTVCGDGVVEGAEECDDFNDFGGDGCSAVCLREIKEVAASSDTQVVVTIMPLGQICRIYNARQHETLEDTTYHLQNTIVTGDVSDPNDLRIHVQVLNGSIAMKPLVDIYLAQGRNDSIWQAIVQRETGVHFEPYSDNMKETVISGTHFEVARFLQYFMYIAPDLDFNGYVSVLFTVVSGMVMNHGAEVCESNVVVRVIPVFNDPASVMVLDSIKNSGYQCQAASASCSLAGISLYDPDCESAVDGSCFLRLELNASLGFLSVPGHPAGWQEVFPSLVGHAAGLNAALERLSFFPPALPPEPPEAALHVSVHRVIERTIATPEGLLPMVTSLTLPIHILSADTPPTLSLSSGDAFHGAVFIMSNTKPHYFTDIVFEPPGAIVTTCIIELKVSKGLLFLGDTGGLWFADGTNNGESRLRFVANSTDIRNRFLADVRYAWDDNDCSNLEQFNITVDSGHHEPLTLIALLVLPDCQGYQAQWMGSNKLSMMEDSEISIGHLNLTTKDTHLFLMVDVQLGFDHSWRGDCKLVRWPESIPSFVPGRECHLDGLVKGLNEVLPYLVYRPPPDFFGTVQLEFIVFKTEARPGEILGRSTGISSRGVPQSILVEIEVAGVNDGPSLEVFLDSYRLQEDAEEYLVLGPMFVTDIDADQNEMSFKFELIAGHEWNTPTWLCLDVLKAANNWRCFLIGTSAIHFNTTVENFNSLQSGPGRLRFRAARDWHGSAVINVSVDDRGSGHGEEFHLSANRSLYIMVEPKVDRPRLSVLCPEQIPFVTYGRNCLEVKDCFALNASLDGTDVGLSFWLVIQADDERVNINLEDRAPVQVWQEGTAELHMAGLYHNIQEALRALVFRPPGQLFEDAYDAHTFEFNVTVTAIALGERFNEPWPITPGPGMRHDARAFPSDQVDFSVVVRRMNRPPLLFIDRPAFSVTQLQADVILYGVTVADPDIRSDDLLELVVSAEEDGPGDLAFAGLRGKRLQRRMRLEELNQALQELTFIFDNANWFGVTGVSLWVSDLGNHGWRVDRKTTPYSSVGLEAEERGELTASSFLAVHRSFVNEPPRIILEEPRSGLLEVFEDHGQFASFMVMHKASEHLVDRMLTVFMSTSHGQLRSISLQNATDRGVRSSLDGKRLEYTAWLYELNTFLAQLEFLPDPNYNGPDELVVMITDGEYEVNTSVPIQIASLTDPLIIVCPPAVDLFEGQRAVPIGANISIRDFEPLPGDGDEDSEVQVEIFVGDGGLQLLPGMPLPPELDPWCRIEPFMNDSEAEELAAWNGTRNGSGDDGPESSRLRVPRIQTLWFNTTLAGFRDMVFAAGLNAAMVVLSEVLKALAFTPYPELYHGVVHFEIRVSMLHTMESARCEIGLVVHPVNSAPVIHFDHSRLWADFSGGWFVEQMHSARLKLEVSCGTMSFLIDYVFGVQNGSIAGLEGITFHKGDGSHDTEMDITSTLANLNLQLSRLFYHSGGECRQQNISLSVELDDLGNFGASKDEMGPYTAWMMGGPWLWHVMANDIVGARQMGNQDSI
ncbi:unnamed protein product [Durusdinium trenchii]|uniref:Uncharacterized protein n=1 Tax=Durusdinium trenchii TaxID=1381693 RepID=A0ABP0Q3Z1_9DINO